MEIVNILILIFSSVVTLVWTRKKLKKLTSMKVEIVEENQPLDEASLNQLADE